MQFLYHLPSKCQMSNTSEWATQAFSYHQL